MKTITQIRLIIATLLVSLLFVTETVAQQVFDARGAGMAFSNSADTKGLDQVGLNPATLALPYRYNFELNLLSFNASVKNNSLNKSLYDQYFTTGVTLNDADKSNILSSIPANGLNGKADIRLNTFAVYAPKFSLSLTAVGNVSYTLPKEVAELALMGNDEFGREYDFSSLDGSVWGGAAFTLGLGFPVKFLRNSFTDFAAIGFGFKYITGLSYFEVINAEGNLQNLSNENTNIQVDGLLEARTALGGTGFGYDLGVVLKSKEKWQFSGAILNALGSVKWNNSPETRFYSINADSLALSSDGFDSLFTDQDSVYTIDAFNTRLPAILDIGAAYNINPQFIVTAAYEQGISKSMGGTTTPRVAIGTEYRGIPLLPLRGGISVGGKYGFSTSLGLSLNFNYWHVDFAMVNHGGITSSQLKGMTFAATTRLRF